MTREDDVRDAVERAFAVSQMQENGGWSVLRADVLERLEAMKREILSGNAGERYAELCGFVTGAEFVLATGERLEATAQALRKG